MESKFLHNLNPSNITGKLVKSDEVLRSNNHKDKKDGTEFSPQIATLDSPILKMTSVHNGKELQTSTKKVMTDSFQKNKDNEFNSGINSNIKEVLPAEILENNVNKLKVMKTIKEQEKQLFHIRKGGNSLKQIKQEEFLITGDTKKIESSHENLKQNNEMVKTECLVIKNELMPSVNKESRNKKISLNSNHTKKTKAESGSKMKNTTDNHIVKDEDNSYKSICLKKKNSNKQNSNNIKTERMEKRFDFDDTRTSTNLRKAVCNEHAILNNNYAPITRKSINKETQSNRLFKRDEAKNLINKFKLKKISRYPDIMTECDVKSESILEENPVGEMNYNEVKKQKTDYESSNRINNKIKENDIQTNIDNKIDISNSNESNVSNLIPTGLRCIRQSKVESGDDKGMELSCLKKKLCAAESIKLKDRDRRSIKSPLRTDIGKSVTLNPDCENFSKLNKYVLKHKKQLEAIKKDKKVKSIKNKLSNNLRSRDESKIIRRQSNTSLSLMNADIGKKISEDNTKESKKEDGSNSQISSINKIEDSKLQTKSESNINGRVNESGIFLNNNSFFDMGSNPIRISTEANKPYFNNNCSENNKNEGLIKTENTGLNFTRMVANVTKEINKERNNIELRPSPYCLKKKLKTNKKNKYRENSIYILKPQPKKVEGFISQSLRSSNTAKKLSATHLMKNLSKSELKQSATILKQKKSKHRILKIHQKKNQNSLKLAPSSKIFSPKDLPLHVLRKEPKKLCKNYFLETPSRQVCGLTPPKRTISEKPVKPKTKLISKLVACTQQKDDVQKQNLKVEKNVNYCSGGYDVPINSEIHNKKSAKEFKPTLTEMWQIDKENTDASNLIEYQLEKSVVSLKNEESKDQNTNLIGRTDLNSDFEQIIDQSKPVNGLSISSENAAKGSERNDSSNSQLITDSKENIGLPSIVGNVVNNVKNRIQNFLLADIAKSNLNRGIIFKKSRKHKIKDLKEGSKTPNHISQENNESLKLNKNSKQILCNNLETHSKIDSTKINSENKDGDSRKIISDLLQFRSVQNKQTCPQMSYSEVLNKFYARCET